MASPFGSKAAAYGPWILKAVLAALFVMFGSFKLMGAPMMVHEFEVLGLGQWFRIATGLIEVGSAILLFLPVASRYAALAMLAVSIGAFIAQVLRLHQDVIHTIVLIAATGVLVWLVWRPWISARAVAA